MSRAKLAYWALFGVTLAVYAAMVFWSLPMIMGETGGLVPFDLRPGGYSEVDARTFLTGISDTGRSFYQDVQHWLDAAYPGLMALSLIFAMLWAFPKAPRLLRILLALLPVIAAGFDYLENARVAVLLRLPVDQVSVAQIEAASNATVFKFVFVTLTLVVLLIGIIGKAMRRWRDNRQ